MPRDISPDEPPPPAGWPDAAARDNLQLIAEGVTQLAGFGVAAINVVRDGALESVAVAGNDQAREELQGTRTTVDRLERELAKADDWGLLRFVPHERLDYGPDETWGWVPDLDPIDAPDAWHPLDLLIAPLYDDSGTLRGTLAMDLPLDGRRPGEAQRVVLNTYAEQAGRAVVAALERETLAEQVRMAQAARRIVRDATAQLSLESTFADSVDALVDGFRAAGMWIQTLADEAGSESHVYASDGVVVELGPELVAMAETAARDAWRSQQVAIVAEGRPILSTVSAEEGQVVVDYLHSIGVSSLLFIPLGAGAECLGHLALTRLAGDPPWTEAEAATALDVGHDLGRAILNARTFEREHQLVEELQALDVYKGQLIATVAHELKNPLTSVLGHLELLESSPDLAATTKTSLAAMERGAQRMVRVIEDLLLLAKVGDARTPLIAVPVDLRGVVDDAVDLNAVTAGHKEITVRVEVPEGPVVALGDPDELDQLCGNLVNNAVKYTPNGGDVDILLSRSDGQVELCCTDTGIGIAAEDLAELGTEFFRSSNPRAVSQPGTGLGLAIVRRILERHGGRLDVTSRPGAGSTFRATLPEA